jgi:hypothetical protein
MRIVSLLFAGLFIVGELPAHEVIWWQDPDGSAPGNKMDFYYPAEFYDYITVAPSSGEPCTVVVNLDPLNSTLISAQVLPPNPANVVDIRVLVLRPANGSFETATITGEWHATGLPLDNDCTALTPNKFSVPIVVLGRSPLWRFTLAVDRQSIGIDAGFDCALQATDSLTGPWLNVGKGQMYKINFDMPVRFFQRFTRLGGIVSGTVTDPAGKPLSGATLGLLYGGSTASADANGAFSFPRMPWGMNLIAITNPIGASLNVVVPATNNTAVAFKVAMAVAAPVTNACNCTPWCAIGFGSLPGGQTPVYSAGGANSPKNAPADCDQPIVTVTTPSGTTYPITPGSSRHQNSGPNPASGTWTVTTTVCGLSKSCSVTVP